MRDETASADAALLRRLKAGEDAAFEDLVRNHGPRMLSVAQRYVRSGPEAEDVVQEALMSVSRAVRSFDGDSRLSTWLHRIVVNCALMRLRSRSRKRETFPDLAARQSDVRGGGTGPLSAVEVADRADLRDSVKQAIERLPELDRAIVRLRDIQGMTLEEVGRLLDIGPTTVKEHLHRARHALRTLLEPVLQAARPPDPSRSEPGTRPGPDTARPGGTAS